MNRRIPIIARETEEYALALPDILRVCIKTGEILVDRRQEYFTTYYVINREVKRRGNGEGRFD